MSVVVKLAYPVEKGGKSVKELTLARLTGIDLIESEKQIDPSDVAAKISGSLGIVPTSQLIALLGRSAGLLPDVVRKMDAADLNACFEVIRGFLDHGQAAQAGGGASSV